MSETRELLNFQGRVFEACIEMQLDAAAWSDHITGFYAKNCLENLFSIFVWNWLSCTEFEDFEFYGIDDNEILLPFMI